MRRYLLILLAALVLLTQWGLVAHAYHEHNDDEPQVCELCLNHKLHSQALMPATVSLQVNNPSFIPVAFDNHSFTFLYSYHYAVRGPPPLSKY